MGCCRVGMPPLSLLPLDPVPALGAKCHAPPALFLTFTCAAWPAVTHGLSNAREIMGQLSMYQWEEKRPQKTPQGKQSLQAVRYGGGRRMRTLTVSLHHSRTGPKLLFLLWFVTMFKP